MSTKKPAKRRPLVVSMTAGLMRRQPWLWDGVREKEQKWRDSAAKPADPGKIVPFNP